jgi:type I restriction enzyme M protein
VIAIMNMILHGIDAPNVLHTNTLAENLADIQEKDRYEVVLANPPFGGKERKEVQQNFPIKTGETAYLFLQHFIKIVKAGGRAGVVIKNTFLSNTDTTPRSACASSAWKAAASTPSWTSPAARSRAQA